MFPWEEYVSAAHMRQFMQTEEDVVVYLAFAYLGLVRYGPSLAQSLLGEPSVQTAAKGKARGPADPTWLRYTMILWNLALSLFSACAFLVLFPAFVAAVQRYGWYGAVMRQHDDLTYRGPAGFWVGLFVLSKVPELIDTLWLVLQKRSTPPFLHWYHHVSVLLFSWMSYATGNSMMIVFAVMNTMVHAVMYFYFAVCAAGYKTVARRFAPLITMLQILQMIVGTSLTTYGYVLNRPAYAQGVKDFTALPCAVGPAAARFGMLMYASYLYLFSRLFAQAYLRPAPRREAVPPTKAS